MNIYGIIVGFGSFLIIGIFHPVVIKAEYYFGTKVWPLFLISGIACIIGTIFFEHKIFTPLLSILGFSFLWSILELFHQEKRVEKGWFPANPRKSKNTAKK